MIHYWREISSCVLCFVNILLLQEEIIRNVFHKYDKDNSGYLEKDEFVSAWMDVLPEAEEIFNREVVEKIFERMDINDDGSIDLEEFKEARRMFEGEARKRDVLSHLLM